ncbi:MAG TPA: hypothetical protein VM715_01645 [Candidatus Acidoferrum sp.]|jgi:hypothetical protein|nr:hypothetical protein [Candidatus Acidoferrum sp.]
MSLTLDAENNELPPSRRRGAREGDFRDLCILGSHGGKKTAGTLNTRGAAARMYTSPPSLFVFCSSEAKFRSKFKGSLTYAAHANYCDLGN